MKAQQHWRGFGRCSQHQLPSPQRSCCRRQGVTPTPKEVSPFAKKGGTFAFSLLLEPKKQRFDPNSYPVLLQRACCRCHHPDGQSDGRSGLRAGPSALWVLLKFTTLAVTNSTPPRKKKKICYHRAYATAKHPIQYNSSLFWELHFTVSLYSVCLSDIAH